MTGRAPVDVAVGVLMRRDGALLLASRPAGKPYADYWEFPGGKIEPGESIAHALARELHEELGITLGPVYPWLVRVHDYPHALVRLHFCRVFDWRGEPHARERQRFGFFRLDALPAPLLPATVPVLRGLALPMIYAISDANRLGMELFLKRLGSALDNGLRLVQLREPNLPERDIAALFDAVLGLVRGRAARLLVSSRHPHALWSRADGVHLTAAELMAMRERPECAWLGASVHSESELGRAVSLGADFAVLGPVQTTASHPGRSAIGWAAFEQIAAASSIPIYALGGLGPTDLRRSLEHGAHGVALLSAAWRSNQCFDDGASLGGVSSALSAVAPGST